MRTRILATACVVAAMSVANGTPGWSAGVNSTRLRDAVTVPNIRAHQLALQHIADANNGTRASGTPGFDASAAYVKSTLESAGYTVTELPFTFPFFQQNSPPEFDRVLPTPLVYVEVTDFSTMSYSGSGNPTAILQNAGGFVLPPTPLPSSASGCSPADFSGFVPGNIALIQRGTCTFAQKATNARAAGASAAVVFNEGNPGRTDNFGGTLGGPIDLPVLSASFAVGSALAALASPTVHVKTDTTSGTRNTSNILAETAGGRNDRVVVVGAHLDSVAEGAGIQDNGSGSATILEVAVQMKKFGFRPVNKVRFMWFGAEESGLLGSAYYVSTLNRNQIKKIGINLNFDMIASPNFVRFVYDGDGSHTPTPGPNGSGVIENVFRKYFARQGLPFEPTAFDGRSDYGPFIAVGIPAGGLFTGAEALKTQEQVAIYGGEEGLALDPCYHQACDTYDNVNEMVLDEMSDAVADAVLQFAMRTTVVKDRSREDDRTLTSVAADSLDYRGSDLQR
jgi:Zn-dependent M28 family amino/carboxypeptidase